MFYKCLCGTYPNKIKYFPKFHFLKFIAIVIDINEYFLEAVSSLITVCKIKRFQMQVLIFSHGDSQNNDCMLIHKNAYETSTITVSTSAKYPCYYILSFPQKAMDVYLLNATFTSIWEILRMQVEFRLTEHKIILVIEGNAVKASNEKVPSVHLSFS